MTASDIAAELERDIQEQWPQLWALVKNPDRFAEWLAEWQQDNGVDDADLEDALDLLGVGLLGSPIG